MKHMKHKFGQIRLIAALLLTVAMLFGLSAVPMTASAVAADGADEIPASAAERAKLSRAAATEGQVLLRNENEALPLQRGEQVAVFGGWQINYIATGSGSGDMPYTPKMNFYEAMLEKTNEGKISLYTPISEYYQQNRPEWSLNDPYKDFSDAVVITDEMIAAAKNSGVDTAVMVIGRRSGEDMDRTAEDYYLSDGEKAMLRRLRNSFSKLIVIMNVCGATDTTALVEEYDVDAILVTWFGGMEGAGAACDCLVGDVTPSGKLTETFAKSLEDYPTTETFLESVNYVNYTEDIYVGYRWFETFDPAYTKVNYPFGFGLSYTDFAIDRVSASVSNGEIHVTARVTNIGKTYAGKEVVEVYYAAPQSVLGNPAKELAAFAKTDLLAPGESQTLEMSFDINDMAGYDDRGKIAKSAYVLEKGDYDVFVGNSVKNAGERGSVYTYTQAENKIVEQLSEKMSPVNLAKRLLADGSYEDLDAIEVLDNFVSKNQPCHVEAEYFDKSSADVKTERFSLDASTYGTCLQGGSVAANKFVEYVINAESAGDCNLVLRAANGHEAQNDFADFYINGEKLDVQMNIPRTGSGWFDFISLDAITVPLKEGRNTLRIVSKAEHFPNIDWMEISYAAEPAKAAAVTVSPKNAAAGASGDKIMLWDVQDDPALMDAFVAQLSDSQLALMHCGAAATGYMGAGGMGNLEEFGIPNVQTCDGPHGIRLQTVPNTSIPCMRLLASSWNMELITLMGKLGGYEAELYNVDFWLAPGMNIMRNPLCGRNFEYYSEDPLVTGLGAAAFTKGVQSQKVSVVAKHFAGNNKESNRYFSDSRMSERALREIYLKGFEIAIKEGQNSDDPATNTIWSIMTSYQYINGVRTPESRELITDILRGEWGWKGLVMTDWGAVSNNTKEILAGNDVKMPTGNADELLASLANGDITRADLENAAKNLFSVILKTNYLAKCKRAYDLTRGNGHVIKFMDRLGNIRGSDNNTVFAENGELHIQYDEGKTGWSNTVAPAEYGNFTQNNYVYMHYKVNSDQPIELRPQFHTEDKLWFYGMPVAASILRDDGINEQWVTSNTTSNKTIILPASSSGWIKMAVTDLVNGDKNASILTRLDAVLLNVEKKTTAAQELVIGNIYLANGDRDIPGLNPPAVQPAAVVCDMTRIDGINEPDMPEGSYNATEKGLHIDLTGTGDQSFRFQMMTDQKNVSGKKYLYFRVEKEAKEIGGLWFYVQLVNHPEGWIWRYAENTWEMMVDGGSWQPANENYWDKKVLVMDRNTTGAWFRVPLDSFTNNGAESAFPLDQLNKLQFDILQYHEPNFTIGTVYAADSDDQVPGLGYVEPDVVIGDADDNGTINVSDVLTIRKHLAGDATAINLANADMNGDGRVDASDVLKLRKQLAGV